jgi:dolichol kinase
MKNFKSIIIIGLLSIIMMSSCATVLGGSITDHQKTKPLVGEQKREIRPVALIAGIFFWPGLIVDFATGAIYKPLKKGKQIPEKSKKIEKLY